jgi:hypothetical protein
MTEPYFPPNATKAQMRRIVNACKATMAVKKTSASKAPAPKSSPPSVSPTGKASTKTPGST